MQKLEEISGVGPKTLSLLHKLNIYNINDLISFYPYKYNIMKRSNIKELQQDDKIIIDGIVENIPSVFYFKGRMNRMTFRINTTNYLLNVVIFNRAFLRSKIKINTIVTIIGKYDKIKNTIIATDIKFGPLSNKEEIIGVYHTTQGLSSNKTKKIIDEVIENAEVKDYLPNYLIDKYNFISKKQAVLEIHNPTNMNNLNKAKELLKYEELFIFMLQMNYLKMGKFNRVGIERIVEKSMINEFIKKLPFKLTKDQHLAVNNIYNDLMNKQRMNRLIQGDVGSGKTIVSIIAMYINYLSGYMSALMVPTEVLAKQHYVNIKKIFKDYNINIQFLTGKMKKNEKEIVMQLMDEGKVDILIGTHALITENVNYYKLGLVITDEQHRFGVNQRSAFKNKGKNPDILYMSATPIPRTYALTLYGDMDISSIKTLPKGRKTVKTYLKRNDEIMDVLQMMYKELKTNHQIYVVVPLIDESDSLDMEWIEKIEINLNKAFGQHYKIKSLHGKMSSEEKETLMNDFKNNKIHILISTTVIEVGVDVANATMIVIYDSYRFGLSTLHQLRGRVGRSHMQSHCILISDKETKRLEILTKTTDGFIISEEDFKLRGSGDLFGTRQSGDMNFVLADIKHDYELMLKAKNDSMEFLNNNKNINNIKNNNIKNILLETNELV